MQIIKLFETGLTVISGPIKRDEKASGVVTTGCGACKRSVCACVRRDRDERRRWTTLDIFYLHEDDVLVDDLYHRRPAPGRIPDIPGSKLQAAATKDDEEEEDADDVTALS